ncbi:trehalose-6-phosphate synthase [Luedemannella flava]
MEYHSSWRNAYRTVNHRFAATIARLAAPDASVWIHDHHLQLVPAALRLARPDLRIGFFLHGLFPPVEAFMRQPMRRELLGGLLGADLIGFQQAYSARNFLDLVADFGGLRRGDAAVQVGPRTVAVRTAPSSVEAASIAALAADAAVRQRAAEIRASLGNPSRVLLSVGRTDPAEGVEPLIDAYAACSPGAASTPPTRCWYTCPRAVTRRTPTTPRVSIAFTARSLRSTVSSPASVAPSCMNLARTPVSPSGSPSTWPPTLSSRCRYGRA